MSTRYCAMSSSHWPACRASTLSTGGVRRNRQPGAETCRRESGGRRKAELRPLRLGDEVDVLVGVSLDEAADEGAERQHGQSASAGVVEHEPDERRAEALAFVGVVDDGVR